MKRYHIAKSEHLVYPLIVFATSYVSPMSKLPLIAKETGVIEFEGRVLFDLLLSNGHARNRFITLEVKGGEFDYFSAKIVDLCDKELLDFCLAFHQTHPEYVQNSSLMEKDKYELVNTSNTD